MSPPVPDLRPLRALNALQTLLSSVSTFVVDPRSDRAGVRLAGPSLGQPSDAHDLGPSAPMVRGAIQVPPAGVPIVLGPGPPDHGRLPGPRDRPARRQGRLAALPVGAPVRFVPARDREPGRPLHLRGERFHA